MAKCPDCKKSDKVRTVRGIIAEQSSKTEGTAILYRGINSPKTTYLSSQTQSDLATALQNRGTAVGPTPGIAQIGLGAVATVILIFASLANLMIGRPEVAGGPILVFFLIVALTTLVWGIALFKKNQVSHRVAVQEAYKANLRMQNDWYCSRCDMAFTPKN